MPIPAVAISAGASLLGGLFAGGAQKRADKRAMKNAKKLSEMQLNNDYKKMTWANEFRSKETDQNYGWETKRADQDSGLRMKEADQSYGFERGLADQQFSFNTQRANQDSGIRMREGEQQFNFSRTLQSDNNVVRERMQQAGFDQDKSMFNLRDEAQAKSTRVAALRAARAFNGKVPTGI